MQEYACGFLFSEDRSRVLLIRKRRPAWQAGKLNGVGGKIEPGETPLQAMRREFREEAGVDIADWQQVLRLSGPDWVGHFFRALWQRRSGVCGHRRIAGTAQNRLAAEGYDPKPSMDDSDTAGR